MLGRILHCSYTGIELKDMPDKRFLPRDEVTHLLWKDHMKQWNTNNLRRMARLLNRMIINTTIPRKGSHEQIYAMDHKVMYAIFDGIKVNWAQFLFDEIKNFWIHKRRTIVYAPYLTRILIYHILKNYKLKKVGPNTSSLRICRTNRHR